MSAIDDFITPLNFKDKPQFGSYYFFKFARVLPSAVVGPVANRSKYPGYGIFEKWTSKKTGGVTGVQEELVRYDTFEYWKPYPDEDYRIYTRGSEFTLQTRLKDPGKKDSAQDKKYSTRFAIGTRVSYGGKLYIVTPRTTSFRSLITIDAFSELKGLAPNEPQNPYSYDDIQLWVIDAGESGSSYVADSGEIVIPLFWYNVRDKTFNSVKSNSYIRFDPRNFKNPGQVAVALVESITGGLSQNIGRAEDLFDTLLAPNSASFRNTFLTSIKEAVLKNYIDKGFSYEASIALAKQLGLASGTGAGTEKIDTSGTKGGRASNNGSGGQSTSRRAGPRTGRTVSVRNNFSGAGGYISSDSRIATSSPQMVQQYRLPPDNTPVTLRHIFGFKPNQINYSSIGSNWIDIDRSGNTPMIDWTGYKLMQVSFSFLVAGDEDATFDFPGLNPQNRINIDIDEKLSDLRKMATAPYPVVLLGFDDMLTNQMRFPFEGGKGVEFVISDFSIASMFRSAEGKINRAQCEITLREIPIETVSLVDFPPLKFPKIPKAQGKKNDPKPPEKGLLTGTSSRVF